MYVCIGANGPGGVETPSLQTEVYGCLVGSGLDRSAKAAYSIVLSSLSMSAFVARPRLNAVALPQAVPRRSAAS
jgi:hypothetical protein